MTEIVRGAAAKTSASSFGAAASLSFGRRPTVAGWGDDRIEQPVNTAPPFATS